MFNLSEGTSFFLGGGHRPTLFEDDPDGIGILILTVRHWRGHGWWPPYSDWERSWYLRKNVEKLGVEGKIEEDR